MTSLGYKTFTSWLLSFKGKNKLTEIEVKSLKKPEKHEPNKVHSK